MLSYYLSDDEMDNDLRDLIDPDLECANEVFRLAGRILSVAATHGLLEDDADYERALLRSVSLAKGEWMV